MLQTVLAADPSHLTDEKGDDKTILYSLLSGPENNSDLFDVWSFNVVSHEVSVMLRNEFIDR